jgi:hypothetical protein
MNPEIEKLIDLALADGEITDKERSVILKKAEKLGEDPDEVEMILDGRFHESKKLKTKEKVGNIKVCPSCGESVKSFQLNCSGCGHELNSRTQSDILIKVTNKISELDPNKFESNYEYHEAIGNIVTNTPIPSNIEDIYQLGLFFANSIHESNRYDPSGHSYKSKARECLSKLKVTPNKNKNIDSLIKELEMILELEKKEGKKLWLIVSIIWIVLLGFTLLIIFFG